MDGSSLRPHSDSAVLDGNSAAIASGLRGRDSRGGEIVRSRVLDLIDEPELAPITLIVAPAGYGKSTVARQWAAHHPCTAHGWYQIRLEHNALGAFLHHVWRAIDEASGNPQPLPAGIAVEAVLERLSARSEQIILVFDDYHFIENPLIHQFTGQLLRNLPSCAHILLLSRQIPNLSLARLRAYGHVRQITKDDLAFTYDEVHQIFADVGVSDELLLRLTAWSEGWIAGLQLALMSVNLNSDHASDQLDRLVASMSSNGLLDDYIVEEVLEHLPDPLRRFVLDSVFLSELDPDLCNAVLDRTDSASMLSQLEGNIVFVSRPEGDGAPLIFHQLFADCVQRLRCLRYPSERSAAELQLRAARWHRDRGEFETAAQYALAAEASEEAKELISKFLPEDLPYISVWKALYWLRQLPESVLRTDTRLFQTYIHTLLANGLINEARPLVETMVHGDGFALTKHQQGWLANHLAAIASADGDRDEVLYQSYRALSLLPMDDVIVRLLSWSYIYREETSRGNRALGPLILQHASINRDRHQRASVCWHFMLQPCIANDWAIQGDLCGAEELIHHFIATLPAEIGPFVGKYRLRLLQIYLEQNRLDCADAEAELILEEMQQRSNGPWFPEALIAIANCSLARGDTENAGELLERALQLSDQQGGRHYAAMTEAARADYWLRTGQTQLAQYWVTQACRSSYLAREFGATEPCTVALRFLLREERLTEAQELAAESLAQARSCDHVAAEIEFLVWSSVLARALGDADTADDDLRQALELGARGRFARVYSTTGIDLTDGIRALLPTLSDETCRHAQRLLGDAPPVDPDGSPLAGLTERECDVLVQLVQGKSNREIADALYISERTVKKHLASLFQKTGASNRTAVALWGRTHLPTG